MWPLINGVYRLELTKEKLIDIYTKLYLTRTYDETLKDLAVEGFWTFYHGIIGEEAVPIGVCAVLGEDDYVVPVHRTQMGVMVSRGVSLPKLTAELLGKEGGYSHGVSGTHMACMERGVLSKTGILGAGLTVAVGVGLSIKLRRTDNVIAVFIGDGASSSGNFHEALNLAAIWNLPLIFILENNGYAWTTSTSHTLAIENLSERAAGYSIPGETVDGNDVIEVYEAAKRAADRARRGNGPTLIECKTYRIMGHHGPGMDDDLGYRTEEEIEMWKGRDPLVAFRNRLLERDLRKDVETVEEESRVNISAAVEFALTSPFPSAETVLRLAKEEVP
jgi:pyruvate dehydrogenase E1 component alpha subunit